MRILLVDDDPQDLLILREGLGEVGLNEVATAGSGAQALEWVSRNHADVVLMDARMPDLDGFETCQALAAAGHQVPVIMLTGAKNHLESIRAKEAGAVGFLHKPLQMGGMADLVQQVRWLLNMDSV